MSERDPNATADETAPGDLGAPGPAPDGGSIGRYVIDGTLGQGGMGVVFRAHDPDLDRPVAIKVLHPSMAGAQKKLLKEGQSVARLRHPNVITVYDVGVHDGALFIAMELVEGGTLRDALHDRPREWREIVEMFVAAGRGLAAAHGAGLVHRDFKPDNVLIDRDGRIVVGDFGLAQEGPAEAEGRSDAAGDVDVTRTAGVAGTPAYMSPEQFRGERLDARSDQFSFCVALWEALYGERPFRGADPKSIQSLAEAVNSGVITATRARSGVPSHIHAALRRGLSRDPYDRFPSMNALLAALQPRTRNRWVIAAAVVGAALLVATALFLRPSTKRLVGVDPSSCAVPSVAAWDTSVPYATWLDHYRDEWQIAYRARCASVAVRGNLPAEDDVIACLDRVAADLDAASQRPAGGSVPWPFLPSLRACSSAIAERRPLGQQAPMGEIFFLSPDTKRVLVGRAGEAPRIQELDTGVTHARLPVGRVLRWLDEDRVALDRGGAILVCSPASGAVIEEIPVEGPVRDVSLAASHAVVETPTGLVLVELATGTTTPLVASTAANGRFSPDGRRVAVIDWTRDEITVVDIVSAQRATFPVPSASLYGGPTLGWLGNDALVVGGAIARGREGWLAKLELTRSGAPARPPEPLVGAGEMATFGVGDVSAGRILVGRVVVDDRLEVRTADRVLPAPGVLADCDATWTGPDGSRFLARCPDGWFYVDLPEWRTTALELPGVPRTAIVSAQGEGERTVGILRDASSNVLFELDRGALSTRPLPESVSKTTARVRCRDSMCVVFGVDEKTVEVLEVGDAGFAPLARFAPEGGIPGGYLNGFDITADGRRIVVSTFAFRMFLAEHGKAPREIRDRGCESPLVVRFATDGRSLLYTCVGSNYALRSMDLATGAATTVLSDSSTQTTGVEVLPGDALLLGRQTRTGTLEVVDVGQQPPLR